MRNWINFSFIQSNIRSGIFFLLMLFSVEICLAEGYGIITTSEIRSAS